MKRSFRIMVTSFGLLVSWACAIAAQDKSAPGDDKAEKAVLRAAASHMSRLTLKRLGAGREVIERVDQPLLSFGDSARVHNHGTLWAWGTTGRPVAFLELFQQPQQNGKWIHTVSLSSAPDVALDTPLGGRWQPRTSSFKPAPLPNAPKPAAKESGRLRQIKDLARRFTAHEFWDPDRSRYELRLLPQPVHRYSDPVAGVQDGGVFVFAHGTNPECLLLIDAVGESAVSARWHYALVRSADAELHVEIDGSEVWTCDRDDHAGDGRSKPYWVFLSAVEADTGNDRPASAE